VTVDSDSTHHSSFVMFVTSFVMFVNAHTKFTDRYATTNITANAAEWKSCVR
jgi:hypothetical protein